MRVTLRHLAIVNHVVPKFQFFRAARESIAENPRQLRIASSNGRGRSPECPAERSLKEALRLLQVARWIFNVVEVLRANPNGVFEESALEALRQWKFEPVQRNGEKVAQRAEIRFNYARN